MAPSKKAQLKQARPAWYVAWTAFGILAAASALVAWRTEGTLLRWIVRDLALLGYIAIFAAIVSSHYKREVSKVFGRSFVNAHHILSVTGAVLLTLHPIGVAWDELNAAVLIPVFYPISDMLRYGGRIAWYIFAVGALAAVWRKKIGRRWRTVHDFNYLAFVFGTVHANLLGANFADWPVRVVSVAMLLVVAVLFVRQRIEARKKQAEIQAKIAAAKRIQKEKLARKEEV
jgi:DMSO/TMAO reductase YedYZ heme-binding membrane subunit